MCPIRLRPICLLAVAAFAGNGAFASALNVCAALPIGTINELVHQNLSGVRADVSEEAHSYGCSYGKGGLVSVSVIRPGGAAAFARTSGRYLNAAAVTGLGDKAVFDKRLGTIALFGDTVINAFVPTGSLAMHNCQTSKSR